MRKILKGQQGRHHGEAMKAGAHPRAGLGFFLNFREVEGSTWKRDANWHFRIKPHGRNLTHLSDCTHRQRCSTHQVEKMSWFRGKMISCRNFSRFSPGIELMRGMMAYSKDHQAARWQEHLGWICRFLLWSLITGMLLALTHGVFSNNPHSSTRPCLWMQSKHCGGFQTLKVLPKFHSMQKTCGLCSKTTYNINYSVIPCRKSVLLEVSVWQWAQTSSSDYVPPNAEGQGAPLW